MSVTPQENAELSKDRILDQFSLSIHKLADRAAITSTMFSVALSIAIVVITLILVVSISCLLVIYNHSDIKSVVLLSVVILTCLIIVLTIATFISTESMVLKSNKLADNAVTLLSSEQVIIVINNAAKIYNDNTP